MLSQGRFHSPQVNHLVHPADRTAGPVLMVFAAIGIPFHIMGFVWHSLSSVFHVTRWGFLVRSVSPFHLALGIALLGGLVFAGYGIGRSQRQAFIVALTIGLAALLTHSAGIIALAAVIYSGLRLFGTLGPKPS